MAEIHGLKVPDLPEGAVPLRVVAIIELLLPAGERVVQIAATDDVMTWEAAGMAAWLQEFARRQMSAPGG